MASCPTINSCADKTSCDDVTDHTPFLPAMAANFLGKKDKDTLESNSEFVAIVSQVFVDSVSQFMKDSKLYKKEVPIDIYTDVKRYDIPAPEGFVVNRVVGLLANKVKIPDNRYDKENIYLNCCPVKDVDKAFYAEVALTPKRIGGPCTFDTDFVERHYDAIETLMMAKLADMGERTWKAKTSAESYRRKYRRMLQDDIHEDTVGGSCITLKKSRLSDRAQTC
jgi:hypothetical protein